MAAKKRRITEQRKVFLSIEEKRVYRDREGRFRRPQVVLFALL